MANEATIFDSFARYNDALLGIEESRQRRAQAERERLNLESIANRVRQENRVEAKAEREANQLGRMKEIEAMALNQDKARIAAIKADQDKLAETRAVHTRNARILQKQISDIDKELSALQEIPMSVRNQNARLVAQSVTKDKATLDSLFNPDSQTDNSNNFGKIPGAEQQALFLAQQLAQRNDATLAPRRSRILSLIDDRKQKFDLLGETMRYAELTEPEVAFGPAEAPPPLAVSDPDAAANAFLGTGGGAAGAPPSNPGIGIVPGAYNLLKGYAGQAATIPLYAARRAGAELFGTQRPELPYREDALQAGNQVLSGPVAQPRLDMLPGAGVGQVFNAPGAPSGVEMQPGSFNTDGLQKLQQILEQTYGPDSFIPEEAFPTIINMARASGWSEEKIQNAANEIQSGNIMGPAYQAALGFYRQSKAMSQGIPAPIQPGQSPGMQFRSGW